MDNLNQHNNINNQNQNNICYCLHDLHNFLPLAPEQKYFDNNLLSDYQKELMIKYKMKRAKNVEKLIMNFNTKNNYIVEGKTLQLYLRLGMKLLKINRVIEFHQSKWLKSYVMFNTNKRMAAKNDFEKNFYKLLVNSIYGKLMEQLKNRVNIEIINNKKRFLKLNAMNLIKKIHNFNNGLIAVEKRKIKIYLDKPIMCGAFVLDRSKLHMYNYLYNYLLPKYKNNNFKLHYYDTDSFIFSVKTDDLFLDMIRDYKYFDLSDLKIPILENGANKTTIEEFDKLKKNFKLFNPNMQFLNKKEIGKFKSELGGKIMLELIPIRSKQYSYLCENDIEYDELKNDKEKEEYIPHRRCKGIKKYVVKKNLTHQIYKNTILENSQTFKTQNLIKSLKHDLYSMTQTKLCLNAFDDKRYMINNILSYAWGHGRIKNINN